MRVNDLVVGMGEVGQALADYLHCAGRDISDTAPTVTEADVLHVAIPWTPMFVEQVTNYDGQYRPEIIIVHSTVPVGTCTPHGWVHSPVRGRHPDLGLALRFMPKWFGGGKAEHAANHWPGDTLTYPCSEETEAGKLWELVQFGLQVRVCQAIWEWSQERGLDPDVVYTRFAESYNDGYKELGERQFIRPVLGYVPGDIGGHCVTQNSTMLDHTIVDWVVHGIGANTVNDELARHVKA